MHTSTKWILGLAFLCSLMICMMPVKAFAGTLSTSEFIDKFEINGDLRVRYEWKEKDVDNEDPVDRWRQRFRLGMAFNNPDEGYKVAAGLVTGPSDATSADSTYSETSSFSKNTVNLDYAYGEHKIDCFKFTAGQQKNPFETSWLLWDSDVRPAGITGKYTYEQFFVTAGGFDVRYFDNDVAYMWAGQAGAKTEMITAALAYYSYTRTGDFVDPKAWANMDGDYKYDVVDLNLSSDIKADMVKLSPYGQVFYNFGAKGDVGQSVLNQTTDGASLDPEEGKNRLGWIVGCNAAIDKFTAGISYAQVGSDSCVYSLKDATFGSELNQTDIKGIRADLGYKITKNFGVNASGFFYSALERDIDQDPTTYQFDINYKF
jgi:hypothetical protein